MTVKPAFSNSRNMQKKLFNQCFDAREVIQSKDIMEPYAATSLDTRDLVCLEVQMTRWKPSKEGDHLYKWIEWKAKLEMKAIYLLGKSTAKAVEVKTDVEFAV